MLYRSTWYFQVYERKDRAFGLGVGLSLSDKLKQLLFRV